VSGTVPNATNVNNTTMIQIGMMKSDGHRRFVIFKPGRKFFLPNGEEEHKEQPES
jgi:hypothetical protein